MKGFFRKKKTWVFVFAAILLILSLNFFQKEFKGLFYSFSAPIQRSFLGWGNNTSDFLKGFVDSKNLKKENDDLRMQVERLLADNASLNEVVRENEFLRRALEIGLQEEYRLSLAQIIGQETGRDLILINQGSEDGIVSGMPVITEQKILLGKVSEVEGSFAWVALISGKESSFDAKTLEGNVSGVVKGQGNSRIKLDFVPRGKEIAKGDLVISSSLGGVYPAGLLSGVVEGIKESDVQPFYDITVSLLFDVRALNGVFVILNF